MYVWFMYVVVVVVRSHFGSRLTLVGVGWLVVRIAYPGPPGFAVTAAITPRLNLIPPRGQYNGRVGSLRESGRLSPAYQRPRAAWLRGNLGAYRRCSPGRPRRCAEGPLIGGEEPEAASPTDPPGLPRGGHPVAASVVVILARAVKLPQITLPQFFILAPIDHYFTGVVCSGTGSGLGSGTEVGGYKQLVHGQCPVR